MENIISDEAFSALDFRTVAADSLTGFSVVHVEPAIGPDGITLLLGSYPALGQQKFVFAVSFDENDGIIYQRATVPDGVV